MSVDVGCLVQPVAELLVRAARSELVPRFRQPAGLDVREKAPGEVVTEADVACEDMLTDGLRELVPRALVCGEEAVSRDRSTLDALDDAPLAWVVDPLDGTRHFARGEPHFGIQVALLVEGRTAAAWIHLPMAGTSAHAIRGAGAFVDGRRIQGHARPDATQTLRGAILEGFFPESLRHEVARGKVGLDVHVPHTCAAERYVGLVLDVEDFAMVYRTLPWDHAPGALLVREAGGAVKRLDAREYEPTAAGAGLLATARAEDWQALRDRLCPSHA